jgi:hypothetical protein
MATRSSSSLSHTHTPSSSISGRIARDTAIDTAPHPHQQVPSRSARQTRNPIHRESQHYPMAERCMCSSCHLSAKLFPRTGDGRIMLPVVPVARTHATAHVHIGNHGAEGSDLTQYMLASNDIPGGELGVSFILKRIYSIRLLSSYSGLGRSSKSSTASEVTMSAPSYPSGMNTSTKLHDRTHMVPPGNSMPLYHGYSHDMNSTSDSRPPAVGK